MNIARALEGVGIALDSIRSNKVRAGLTILGVAIGVMVVIGMASAITGINRSITTMLESAGPKTFFVQRFFQGGLNISDGSDELSPWRKNPWITVEDAEMIRQLPTVQAVAVSEGTEGPVSYEDVNLKGVQIGGMGAAWVLVNGGEIVSGRTFTNAEYAASSHVAVINDKLAEGLFARGVDPIGKRIKVFGEPFTIIGVHVEAASLFGGGDQVRMAIPHTAFVKIADYWKGWMDISVLPTESATSLEAQEEVISAMRANRGLKPMQENNFAVLSQDKILDTFNSITAGFFAVMVALSGVGLMVGGVGVVAIMMISVTERTREIGVRKALGATKREIMFQFLVEAATLTLVGGAIGLALGALIAVGIRSASTIPASVPLWSIVVSLLASVVTGVLFGLYPAFRAARLDPVEALRFE